MPSPKLKRLAAVIPGNDPLSDAAPFADFDTGDVGMQKNCDPPVLQAFSTDRPRQISLEKRSPLREAYTDVRAVSGFASIERLRQPWVERTARNMHDLLKCSIMGLDIGGGKRPGRGRSSRWRAENVGSIGKELPAPHCRGSPKYSKTSLGCAVMMSSFHFHPVQLLASAFECRPPGFEEVNVDSVSRQAVRK